MLGRRFRVLTPVAVLAVLIAACGGPGAGADDRALTVVATTTQAADLARDIGGPRVRVVGLLAPNADPHEYEVRPDDVKALVDAALVVRSGGDVDAWLQSAVQASGTDAETLPLIDAVRVRRVGGKVG